jgi:hypothetical protein
MKEALPMARPRKAVRPIEKNISIPEDLVCKVDLRLFSELEGRVPHGAWSRYVSGLIRKELAEAEGRSCGLIID